MTSHAERRERLRRRVGDAGLDALLVVHLPNVRYLTGFSGSAGRLLVTASGGDRFVTDGRYAEQAVAEVAGVPRTITRTDDWLPQALHGCRRLGLESHVLSWDAALALSGRLAGVELVPAGAQVEALRALKDVTEIGLLARACAIADEAFADLLAWLRPGVSEREVALRLERSMIDRGAGDRAFPTIVAAGPNGGRPHHRAGDRRLQPGDLVTLDFGALVGGYHSDMTRLVALGPPPARLRDLVAVVGAAQAAGVAAAVAGAACADVDAACRRVVAAAGYADAFPHGTGHGVGLEIHEAPKLFADATGTLSDRMTVTVEPGIYLPGVGGARIEDTVVVGAPSDGGTTVLTRTPKDLVVL